MNTGDPSSGEENSQSYCSDSSSIPSTLSDCEGVPVHELPFSLQNSLFSSNLKFVAHGNASTGLPSVEDGNSVPPSHGATVNQINYGSCVDRQPNPSQTGVKSVPLERDSAYQSDKDCPASKSAAQTELDTLISASEQQASPSKMSRTLPAKIGDRSQPPLSTHPPADHAATSPGTKRESVPIKHQSPVTMLPQSGDRSAEGGRSADGGGQGAKCVEDRVPASGNTEETVSATASKVSSEPPATASKTSDPTENQVAATGAGAGYSPIEEDSELRPQPVHPQPLQHQPTAFPIPPPLVEQAESLMPQIDTLSLPNVSPDSGIQSIAGSPSGNDSPGSVTSVSTGEATGEPQPAAAQMQSQVQPSEGKDLRQQELPLQPQPPPPLPPPIAGEDKRVKEKSEDICGEGQSAASGSTVTEVISLELDKSVVVPAVLTEIPSPFRGPSIGRKKRGRPPKRNKTQMFQHKKSTLYSGLYTSDGASASGSTSASAAKDHTSTTESPVKNDSEMVPLEKEPAVTSPESESADVSSESAATISETKQPSTHCDKVGSHKAKCIGRKSKGMVKTMVRKDTATDGSQAVPAMQKRGRGRPKGSKNKRLTFSKNRVLKARVAKPHPAQALTEKTAKLTKGLTACTVERVMKKSVSGAKGLKCGPVGKEGEVKGSPLKKVVKKAGRRVGSKGNKGSRESPSPSQEEQVQSPSKTIPTEKRKRGRPRKIPLPETSSDATDSKSNADIDSKSRDAETGIKPLAAEKPKAVADSELASLIQSVQHSIRSQFPVQDMDESSEFTMDTNNDISEIEPSLPQVSSKSPVTKVAKKVAPKSKKPKLHVMMRKTKRRKRKRVQKDQPQPVPAASSDPPASEDSPQSNSSFHDLSQQQQQQQQTGSVSNGSLFGPSTSKPLGFFNRYRPSKLLKQSSFRLHSSALGSALNRTGDDSSGDDDRDGSEGRKRKKKKKLLYFKSKHKNIIDPAFMAEVLSLELGMGGMTISEQAFIRVKPGEVPLPSIFRLTIIDVKKKKKDKLVLEPPPVPEKSKKVKVRKDSKERELAMPELVKEKGKNVRKKSQSEDNHPPSLEIQVARDQCLPPKKRHRMMYAAESTEDAAISPKEAPPPEKRKVGRPRKNPLPESSSASDRPAFAEGKTDSNKVGQDRSQTAVSTPSRASQKKGHRSSPGGTSKEEDTLLIPSSQELSEVPLLACPRHAHHKSLSEVTSCAECTLIAQSQPQASSSKSHARQQSVRDFSPQASRGGKPNPSLIRKQKLTVTQSQRKGTSASSDSRGGTALSCQATSPRSRTKLMAASLPSAEVVINPLPESAVSAVVNSRSTRKSLHFQCNTSDLSDSGGEDESVIRSVCSEFEPLPLEHCRKRKLSQSEPPVPIKCKKRAKDSPLEHSLGCDDSTQRSPTDATIRRNSDDSQPPRKRYQRVGLFSDFYKEDEPKKRNETKSSYSKGDSSPSLLPPPIHFGKHFRETVIDFQLPYDIWWLYKHDSLPKKEVPRPKFKRIRNNVYVDVKPSTRKFEPPTCECKRPSNPQEMGCLDDCLNRMLCTECSPETCPCGDQCSNQRIQRQDWAPAMEKFLTDNRGFGVRTLKPIEADRIILEYLGEVVSPQEFRRRMTEEYSQDCHHYCLNIDSRQVIDGYRMGNLTRFVNHSCEPNCEMQKWTVNGLCHMVLKTLREIKPYEEITYDYNFDSFNMEAQQACRCGSSSCRGVIGGKFQRSGQKQQQLAEGGFSRLVSPSLKPMSQRERVYARKHSIFLVRNIDRTRGDRRQGEDGVQEKTEEQATLDKVPDLLSMKDSMNDNRSVKTRLVALAEENPELQRRHRLAVIFNNVYNTVASCRDEDGSIMAGPLMVLPSRKKYPDYYRTVSDPIDLTTIRNNIKRGHYVDMHTFDADFLRLFRNVELYCGKKSDMGRVIGRLRRVYQTARNEAIPQIEEVTGETVATLSSAAPSETDSTKVVDTKVAPAAEDEEEDIIRCICGVYRDEGVMIQCEKCFIWQHCDCVNVKASDAEREDLRYHCEICEPRPVEKEILDPQKKDQLGPNGEVCQQYLTLLKDDMQIAQGDCVYLMRDYKRPARTSLRLVASARPEKMDIFRVEDLFKNMKGERFATGNLYLRPHETFHEPNRKFFHNELFRHPQFETYPLEQVAGKCMVMDLNTYCKGRPKGFDPKDIYICEYRVDKTAHLFTKISKNRFPINTKSFCFDKYPERLCPKRTYVPHEVPEEYLRRYPGDRHHTTDSNNSRKSSSSSSSTSTSTSTSTAASAGDEGCKTEAKGAESEARKVKGTESEARKVKVDRKEGIVCLKMEEEKKHAKKERLNSFLLKLLATTPSKSKLDLSYLLEESLGKRPRKKTPSFC